MSFSSDHLKQLPFYLTRPSPCPYLPGQVEQRLFTRLTGEERADFLLNSTLNQTGFRRSQSMVYRPACPSCLACVPVRLSLKDFKPTQSLRRILRRNGDLICETREVHESIILFPLFSAYQKSRHADSDMVNMSLGDYTAMMQEGAAHSFFLTLRDEEGNVLAAMLADRLQSGVSAVYSFYDPREDKRSLGTALILHLVEWAKAQSHAYIYLGYWIKECRKMNYKSRFPALQRLGSEGWESF